MKPNEFITQLDEARIVEAIGRAERRSSGEIRVYISRRRRADPLAMARKRFLDLGMTGTRHRNGVLIYIAPLSRTFAIVGDTGVHDKCGDAFWQEVSGVMAALMKAGRYTEAVVAAVEKVGEVLARHFPREPGDQNELPDRIVRE
jgi:uncharacterized membrane protein